MSVPSGKSRSLLQASAEGIKFLILLQISSRLLTFLVNQLLLRYLSPELLGLSIQYELFVTSVLYFSRESLRTAVQRYGFAENTIPSPPRKSSSAGKLSVGTPAAQSQTIVNLSYLTLPLGLVFAGLLYRSIASVASAQPYFNLSIALYLTAIFLELLSEPAFAVIQQKLHYKVRAGAESAGALARCVLSCGVTIYVAKHNAGGAGSLPFALGQLGFAVVLLIIYSYNVYGTAKETGFSLGILGLASSDYYFTYFHKPLLTLAFSMWIQSAVKHILTQGDSLLIAWLATSYDQGIYALASNYGSLVARILFQPLEESSRNFFAKLLSQSAPGSSSPNKKESRKDAPTSIESAASILRCIVRLYLILSIFAISIGPPAAPFLLRIVAGSRWANSSAGEVLSTYCYYIPLLAINGITEAFVQSVASSKELHRQSIWMFGFSVGFGVAGYILLRILRLGAEGLVWANVVNMAMRIIWSQGFIKKYFRRNGLDSLRWQEAIPDFLFVSAGIVVGAMARSFTLELSAKSLLKFGILAGGLGGICALREWKFFLNLYHLAKSGQIRPANDKRSSEKPDSSEQSAST